MGAFKALVSRLKSLVVARFHLALENLALRHQVEVLERSGKRPKLRQRDRVFWVLLSALWPDWRSALVIVKPETVIGWRRRGFRLCWCWKSRSRKPGRPPINEEIRKLIRRMSQENLTWGAPRIESELRLLGYAVAERTVAKYMMRAPSSPTQTWRTFLEQPLTRDDGHRCCQGVQVDAPSVLPFRTSPTRSPIDLSHPFRHDRWGR